ncbi:hypothetical protein BGZ63DRAFT_394712 [Mariannaea sp. PMI_226]|nr:hypothetical protein BGZ63DRAFT_394712 [Mariannaea sp. PMI_226]
MASPFKNILLVGGGGSIGSIMLKALLAEPSFTVTVLQRTGSTSKLPEGVKVITIDDSYPLGALTVAFKGQDAIVNCMTTIAVTQQLRFIDAAVAAGVKRYIPSEYGLNNNKPEARAVSGVFSQKGQVQDYLRTKEAKGMEWTAIACGMWLRWSATHNFLGMNIKEKKMEIWDDGEGWISCTTEDNTALALVNSLTKKWEETKNRIVYLSDFAITGNMLLESIERQSGEKFTVTHVNTEELLAEKKPLAESGDFFAFIKVLETGFASGKFGGHLEKEGEIMNDVLELPKHNLDEVVKVALEAVAAM